MKSMTIDRQKQLQKLIAAGKEKGYLTYAEVNDHLPDGIVDPDQIEDIINMINDMGVTVHEQAPDADALLPAALAQSMELGAVEELAEDAGNLILQDPRPVVGDLDPVAVLLDGRDHHPQRRMDAGLFASVERVVDRFLDGCEQRLGRAVEAEEVSVLGEELGNRDLALRGRHRLGGSLLPQFARFLRHSKSSHSPRNERRR